MRSLFLGLRALRLSQLTEQRLLALSMCVVWLTACNSVTFFHPDEHYQILEFAGLKLGFTEASALPWEFAAGIRPFFQPAVCFGVIRGLQILGIDDRFVFALVLRVLFGTLYWASLVCLCKVHERELFRNDVTRRRSLYWLLFAGFVPYLAVRTSSETFSAALFALAAALLVPRVAHGAVSARLTSSVKLHAATALLVGGLLGLAFEARYQTAIMTAGLGGWLLSKRISWRAWGGLAVGFGCALALGAVCDRWGYGSWCFPAAAYFRANLLQGVAKQYGTSPLVGYLYLPVANVFAPVVVALLVGLVLTWMRYPRHLVTWVTLPFVGVHSLLAHKEERFLFPMLPFVLLALYFGVRPSVEADVGANQASPGGRLGTVLAAIRAPGDKLAAWVWARRNGAVARVILGINFAMLALLAVYPLGWRPHHALYAWVAATHPNGVEWSASGEQYPDYPFFRSAPWTRTAITERALQTRRSSEPVQATLVLRDDPFAPEAPNGAAHATLVYSEFPGYQFSWVRRWLFPLLRPLRTPQQGKPFLVRTRWYSVYRLE